MSGRHSVASKWRHFHLEAAMFNIGDKVILNSGSPIMTVTGFSPRGKVWTEWELTGTTRYSTLADAQEHQNGQPAIEEASFPPEALTLHQ
jgi:uncharacterized protein YodC (DUF2158 family)